MFQWAANHIVWFFIRCAVTLVCILTVQNVIGREGYRVEFYDLLASTVCVIIVTRFWAARPADQSLTKDK
jgi:hypothetical protein